MRGSIVDKQHKIDSERVPVNFIVFYELDQETVKTALRLEEYGGDSEDSSWVLLEEEAEDARGEHIEHT